MKFGKLIIRKIIKIFATRCLILGLKCTNNRFRLGELTALPRLPSWIWGPYFEGEGRGGKGRRGERRGREGKGREGRKGKGKGKREERGGRLLFQTFLGPEV